MTAVWSDRGIRKNINQDSALIEMAETDCGKVLLAAVCDGVGGLDRGEAASSALILALSEWFENVLPHLLMDGGKEENLRSELEALTVRMNCRIKDYGTQNQIRLGTTLAAILLTGDSYCMMNVGDSRIYKISDGIFQMTRDQTCVQHEIERKHISHEEAIKHPQRNMLLQCVGASEVVVPEFIFGTCEPETNYLICSDGFRHKVTSSELYESLRPELFRNEEQMEQALQELTGRNRARMERDDITAVLVRTCREV